MFSRLLLLHQLEIEDLLPLLDTHRMVQVELQLQNPEVDAMLRQLQEQAAAIDRLNAKVDSLNALLTSKDEEILALAKRNEEQFLPALYRQLPPPARVYVHARVHALSMACVHGGCTRRMHGNVYWSITTFPLDTRPRSVWVVTLIISRYFNHSS